MELLEGMYHNAMKGCVCFVFNRNLGILNMCPSIKIFY